MVLDSISVLDLIISGLTIIAILLVAYFFRPKKHKPSTKFFFPFIFAKIIFAIIFVLIHVYYYNGGDTFLYFSGANFFADQVIANPLNAFKLYLSSQENIRNIAYTADYVYAINSSSDVFFMSKVIGVFTFPLASQFLATSILFTLVTAIGIWKLFEVMCSIYPNLSQLFAYGILFYPSLGIWGSGILKDPLTLCSVGLIFWSTYNIVNGRNRISSMILIAISAYFCYILKPYILYTFIPIMLLWTQGSIVKKVNSPILKVIITPVLLIIFSIGAYYAVNTVSEGAGKYSLESVQSVAEGFHSWHSYLAETRDQSGYSLGEIEFTASGILQKSPEGFFVTYYRPFIFVDTRNVATFFEAIQTFILLVITLIIILRVGILKFLKLLSTDSDVRAFMLFAIVFGVAVGITSYNFGALSRYKIPSLPFYVASLAIIYYKGYLLPKRKIQL